MRSPFQLFSILLLVLIASIKLSAQSVSYSDPFTSSTFTKDIDLSKPVGSIDGVAGTSPNGGVTYTIPIKLPPGTKGMIPNLSIVYNSQGGNGLLGQGWSITGLSAISRTGKDIYHDGKLSPVTYTNDDAFVLDGSRLSVKTLTNGADLATYRTEAESYSVTTSYGNYGGGPSYFIVVSKDGTLMEYGKSDDSRVLSDDGSKVMLWRLNKIRDINGNYVWFTYENGDRDFRIKEIKYTGNDVTSLQPYNIIRFNYSVRDDKNMAYDNGYTIKSHYLLTSININEIATLESFKSYSFWYGKNNSASYLKAVYEHNASGESLNDTRFKYGDNVSEKEISESNIDVTFTSPTSSSSTNNDIFSGDFDGDGKTEILKAEYNGIGSSFVYNNRNYLNFSVYKEGVTPNNYSAMAGSYTALPSSTDSRYFVGYRQNNEIKGQNFIASDFNGDGKDDLLFMNITTDILFNGVSIYYSRLGTSSPGFDKVDIAPASLSGTHQMKGENIILLGDFDGDKRTDYMYMTKHQDGAGSYLHTFVSFPGRGENNRPIMIESIPSLYDEIATMNIRNDGINSKVFVIDFDGDGVSEILCMLPDGNLIYKLAKTSAGVYYFKTIVSGGVGSYPTERYQDIKGIGDFNGDGKDDFVVNSKANRFWWEIAYSDGKGFKVVPFLFSPFYQYECNWTTGSFPFVSHESSIPDAIYIGDYNGDGKSDILHERKYCNSENMTKTDFIYYYFNGLKGGSYADILHDKFSFTHYGRLSDVIRPILTDVNGDGKQEFSFKNYSPSGVASKMQTLYFRKDSKSQLLEKVTDGFNRTTEFAYEPLTKGTGTGAGDFYVKGNGETYPVNNGQYPIYVVTSVKAPDGIGGTNTTYFGYENLRLHRAGRGLLGFEKIKNYNVNSDIRTETTYDLGKDALGINLYVPYPKTIKTFLNSSSTPLTQSDNTYSFDRVGADYCFVQNNTSSIVQDFQKGTSTTTTNTIDGNGNLTYTSSLTTGGPEDFLSTTTTTYTTTSGVSIPNRPQTIITSSKRGSMPEVKTKNKMVYDGKGNVTEHVSQPEPYIKLDNINIEDYWYDDYGNVTKKKAKSFVSLLEPFTEYKYDAQGRFPIEEMNTIGDLTKTSFHKFWGKPTSIIGINGLTTTYTYDDWGKLTSSTVPFSLSSGKTITYSESWESDLATKQLYYTLTQDPTEPDLKVGFDVMGRSVKTLKETFGSAWAKSLTTYNAKGNVLTSTNYFLSSETPIITTNTYDELNRIKTSTNVYGTTSYNYVSGSGITTTTITMPDTKVKITKVDALGKILESSNGIAGTVEYKYDSRGNEIYSGLKIFSSASHEFITKGYDENGRLVFMKDQDAGDITYKYTTYGQIKEQKESLSGKTTAFKYDIMGRIIQKDVGAYQTKYLYTDKSQNYQLSQIQTIGSDGTVTDNYEYEYGIRLKRHTRTTGTFVMKKDYGYDPSNRLVNTTYFPSNFATHNTYDANGFLIKVRENVSGTTVSSSKILYECLGMNGSEQVTSYKRADGATATIEYDKGFATRYYTPGYFSTPNQDLSMTYNIANGNVLSRTDNVGSTRETFTYDMADRLIRSQAEKFGAAVLMYAAQEIEYDSHSWTGSFGQIVSKSDIGNYYYSGFPKNAINNIVVGSSTVISHAEQNIEYNDFNKAKKITEPIGGIPYQENFIYNGAEERTYSEQLRSAAIARKRWYMDDYEIQESTAPTKTHHIHYIYGDAGLCGIVVKEGTTYNFYAAYTDHLGSIVAIAEETTPGISDIVTRQSYDAWGRERNPDTWGYPMTGIAPKPVWLYRGYTGHEMLPEYGLVNMNARFYDPANGRMLRPDNLVSYPDNTQSYNRFSYAMNNPMSCIDPDGNHPILLAVAIGVAVSAGMYTYQVSQSPGGFNNWNWMSFTGSIITGATTGAISGGSGFLIGEAFGPTGSLLREIGRAGAHGASNYLISGGNESAFLSGAFGSFAGSWASTLTGPVGAALNTTVGGTIFAAAAGGAGSAIDGGNFWEGAAIGATVHLVNYVSHCYGDLIAGKALKHIGSTEYAYEKSKDDYEEGTNKCNKFVDDVLVESEASPGLPNGNPVKKVFGKGSPTTAGQWADSKYNVPGWKIVKSPRAGDVVAIKGDFSDATGHVAIMISKHNSVGAGHSVVHITNFGSSKSHFTSYPGNNGYVYRRYVGR